MLLSVLFAVLLGAVSTDIVRDSPTSIINGVEVGVEDYPFYAFLAKDDMSLHCGGAFIDVDLVLTAAHCLETKKFKVYAGITTAEDLPYAEGIKVKAIAPHPEFYDRSSHDIGLVRLAKNITLGLKVQTIELSNEIPEKGQNTTVVGFGVVKCEDWWCFSPSSKHLRTANIHINKISNDGVIYTNGVDQNTCYGDSGGPIVYDNKVVGVVSSGQYRDCSGYDTQCPVAPFLEWINETAQTL